MSNFNRYSRTRNVLKSSVVATCCNLMNTLLGFAYRSVFLHILSTSYLGINGLFANILQVLSITDMGISTAIAYRFYDPISKNDVQKVGRLLVFSKKIYFLIACVIFSMGMILYPFLDFFIKDTTELPPDVNIRLVYLLYLIQTLSGYLYSYKHTILTADQKQYIQSLSTMLMTFVRYLLQILSLWIWKDFMLALIANILTTVFWNFVLSIWVTYQYKEVFRVKEDLPKEERQQIYRDTKATMMHRIGRTVVSATDSIVISKYVGLAVTGLYSNYTMIISSLSSIVGQMLSSFTASVGNAHVELKKESSYTVYKRLLFLNFWISGMVTTCLFVLINDFICLWVGREMQMSVSVVVVLCVQFYLQVCRRITMVYTEACGLFVKDRMRSLVEAAINLGVSILLATRIGIVGVFVGTVISCLLTAFWREPYILYKYEFQKSTADYWKLYACFGFLTLLVNIILYCLLKKIMLPNTLIMWILQGILCVTVYNVIAIAAFFRSEEFNFYWHMLCQKLWT